MDKNHKIMGLQLLLHKVHNLYHHIYAIPSSDDEYMIIALNNNMHLCSGFWLDYLISDITLLSA